jgi:pyridoxine 5-phosphate synthase
MRSNKIMTAKLNVNIDHVATVREARKTIEPSVLEAARICEEAGAHGITVHIRGDRRHIQDLDIEQLRDAVKSYLNVELAATDEMVAFAERVKPDAVSLVPEGPNEITTEGGLDVIGNFETVKNAVGKLKAAGIFVSIFIDPDIAQIYAAKNAGAEQIELCTAEYAHLIIGVVGAQASSLRPSASDNSIATEIERIRHAATHAKSIGLIVAAGHGLTTENVKPLAAMPEITEFNIGHHIISRSIFVGLENAVKEMLAAIER